MARSPGSGVLTRDHGHIGGVGWLGRGLGLLGRVGGPLTRKRHIPPHSAQPQHTNHWATRTRKRHQQEHRRQRPTERSDPTQHAKGRTGDCPGPRKGATTRRTVPVSPRPNTPSLKGTRQPTAPNLERSTCESFLVSTRACLPSPLGLGVYCAPGLLLGTCGPWQRAGE